MPIQSPIYSAVIQRSFMESTAEELFELGRIDLEEERVRAPEGFSYLLTRFFAEASSPELDARLAAESLAALIIVDFQRSLWPSRVSRGALGPQFRHPGIIRARRMILREYGSELGVAKLAQIANLSVTQFITVFKRETGKTPHQFLRRVRVDSAQRLLARGFDVIDAGFSVGFSSVSGFRSAFKKLVGMTPEEYWLLRRK
jgi:AraC family transcriptional regulator